MGDYSDKLGCAMTQTPVPTRQQQRSGAAATLLSLDVVIPFYSPMGVPAPEPARFVQVLRECIVDNRKEFHHSPDRIPDLDSRIDDKLRHSFGGETAHAYDWWVQYIFVSSAEDFEAFSDWYMVLALSARNESRWDVLALPKILSREARVRIDSVLDRNDLHQIADQVEAHPLSPWDLEMYTLHGFDEDENDPYNWVLETVKKRRFIQYMSWLVKRLSQEEVAGLWESAEALRKQIETTAHSPSLPNPLTIIEPYANTI